ncbi:hypothetical protein C8Q75DRAFT_376016 [Abortiporus biennis]|nr:hypothetical protein C8Q75DRAFT_376016 [Abortiporus biennis]
MMLIARLQSPTPTLTPYAATPSNDLRSSNITHRTMYLDVVHPQSICQKPILSSLNPNQAISSSSPRLPQDVFDMLIYHLCPHKPTLSACSLKCRSWLPIARFYLFSEIRLDLMTSWRYTEPHAVTDVDDDLFAGPRRDGILHTFIHFLDDTPLTATYIRQLVIQAEHPLHYLDDIARYISPAIMLALLEKLPLIQDICLRNLRWGAIEPIQPFHPSFQSHTLRSLYLDGISFYFNATKPENNGIKHLLNFFNRIEFLGTNRMEVVTSLYEDQNYAPSAPIHINSLRQRCVAKDASLVMIVHECIAKDTLEHLELEEMSDICTAEVSALIHKQINSLSSIIIDIEQLTYLPSLEYDFKELHLSECRRLSTACLEIGLTCITSNDGSNCQSLFAADHFMAFLAGLPPTISQITLTIHTRKVSWKASDEPFMIFNFCEDWPWVDIDVLINKLINLRMLKVLLMKEFSKESVDIIINEEAQKQYFCRVFGLLPSLKGKEISADVVYKSGEGSRNISSEEVVD